MTRIALVALVLAACSAHSDLERTCSKLADLREQHQMLSAQQRADCLRHKANLLEYGALPACSPRAWG
jgi:hypothetical protein